ncbi:MAG: transglutaminase domain-containing protein [Eubacteriales bacterium]|nr:transglutaminase domain-containing protein [Eubacteriales bacterium]
MDRKKVSSVIYEIILTCIGVFGIVSVPLTCILPEVSLWLAAFLSIIGAILWCSILNMSGGYRLAGAAGVFVLIIFYGLVNISGISSSVIYCIQRFVEEVRRESGTVLAIGDSLGKAKAEFDASLLFLLVMLAAMILAAEVVFFRSMAAAIITVIPFLAVFILFSVIPHVVSFLCCTLYIFVSSARSRESSKITSGYIILAAGIIVYLGIVLFVPQKSYERKKIFSSLYNKAEYLISSISESFFGIDAPGGINYGQLGKIHEVKFSDAKLATVTTIETGRNQYFKTFTGAEYKSDQWSASNVGQDRITEYVFNMMDASEELQRFLTGETGDEYYRNNKYFSYILQENPNGEKKTYNGFSVGNGEYSKFKLLADRRTVIKTSYERKPDTLLGTIQFSAKEGIYRETVQRDYGEDMMPDSVRALMKEIIGEVEVNTYDKKREYIEFVKKFLQENYTYTVTPGRVPDGRDFLEYFLKDSKKGYCTYFATAAAMMFRYAGIPARYCEGYVLTNDKVISGTVSNLEMERYTTDGTRENVSEAAYTIELTDRNAHAWVEVYMDGYGWIPIEATPGNSRSDYMAEAGLSGDDKEQGTTVPRQEESQTAEETTKETANDTEEETYTAETEDITVLDDMGDAGQEVTPKKIYKVLIIIAGILLLLIFVWLMLLLRMHHKKKAREKLLKEKDEERIYEQAASLYDYFIRMLKVLGYNKPEGMDYEEYVNMLETRDEQLRKCGISRVMELLLRIRFSQGTVLEDYEFEEITKALKQMELLVYLRVSGAKKLKIKYIDVL